MLEFVWIQDLHFLVAYINELLRMNSFLLNDACCFDNFEAIIWIFMRHELSLDLKSRSGWKDNVYWLLSLSFKYVLLTPPVSPSSFALLLLDFSRKLHNSVELIKHGITKFYFIYQDLLFTINIKTPKQSLTLFSIFVKLFETIFAIWIYKFLFRSQKDHWSVRACWENPEQSLILSGF